MIKLQASCQVLKVCCSDVLVSDSLNAIKMQFAFTNEWRGLSKTVQFVQKDEETEEIRVYNVLLDDENIAMLPNEITTGTVLVSVFGVDGDTKRLTTNAVAFPVTQSGFMGDGQTPIPPTPDLYQQYVNLVYSAAGVPVIGENGNWHLNGIDTGIKADWSAEQENAAASAEEAAASAADAEASATRAEAVKASIPEDYTALSEGVAALSEEMGNALGKTMGLPCSFYSASDKLNITCEGYEGKKIFISNKNLLPQFPTQTNNGVTCTKNEDGSITLSGTSTGVASFILSINVMPQIGPGVYTLSANNTSAIGDDLTFINIGINDAFGSIAAKLNEVDGKTTFTVNEGDSLIEMRIRIASGVTLPDNYTLYPQLEEGTEKTEFVKHEGFVLNPTSGEIEGTGCFVGYNYICAQAGVTGSVTYVQMQSVKLDNLEKRVKKLEAVDVPTRKYAGKTIVCFGDSITGNYLSPEDYPSMIASITGATVYNVGFGGCTMSYHDDELRREFSMVGLVNSIVSGNFSAQENSGVSITAANGDRRNYVPERIATLKSIDWSTVDYITIAYGTNDWNSNYAIDNENNPLDTTSYIGAFRYSVEQLLTKYPNIKILVITPLWRWWDETAGSVEYRDSDTYAKGTGWYLYDYGNALIEACKEYHIPCFDLYYECMMNKLNRYVYFPANDGTHPNIVGRMLMAEKISARLESVY